MKQKTKRILGKTILTILVVGFFMTVCGYFTVMIGWSLWLTPVVFLGVALASLLTVVLLNFIDWCLNSTEDQTFGDFLLED